MSKYYKAGDVIRAIEEMQNCYNGWSDTYDKAQIIGELEEIPTIEVSEDCISRADLIKVFLADNECDTREEAKACMCSLDLMLELIEDAPSVMTKTQTETQNSNENSNVISVSDGVSEMIRCAMCNNPNQSYKGCDGACSYDEKLYKRIMDAINASRVEVSEDCISRKWLVDNAEFISQYDKNMWVVPLSKLADAPSVIPTTEPQMEYKKWETPPKVKNEGIITTCVGVPVALIEDELQTESEDEE